MGILDSDIMAKAMGSLQMDSVLSEKWFDLSLAEQMVNIGNEVKRALKFSSNPEKRNMFLDEAIQYTCLTMEDPQNVHVYPV